MSNITPRTTVSSLLARCLALAAIVAVGFALLTAAAAHADTKDGSGGSRGCAVEDENGNVTYVPEGTHYLLFTCGSDGEWHFGWLISGAKAQLPPKGIGGGTTVSTGGIAKAPVAVLKASATTTSPTTKPAPHRHPAHKPKHRKHSRH